MMKKIRSWTITAIFMTVLMALNVHIAVDQPEQRDSNTSFIQITDVLAKGIKVKPKVNTIENLTTKGTISFF